jgi:hypothetical protein
LILVVLNLAAQVSATRQLEPVELRARLLAPMTTQFTRKGDMVSAWVLAPGRLQGSILEGDVREVRGGAASSKHASIQFQFLALHVSGSTIPVSARVLRVASSKGREGLDDDGLAIEIEQGAEHRGKLSSIASALHIAGGKQESASHLTGPIRMSTNAMSVSLATGSEFVIHIEAKE